MILLKVIYNHKRRNTYDKDIDNTSNNNGYSYIGISRNIHKEVLKLPLLFVQDIKDIIKGELHMVIKMTDFLTNKNDKMKESQLMRIKEIQRSYDLSVATCQESIEIAKVMLEVTETVSERRRLIDIIDTANEFLVEMKTDMDKLRLHMNTILEMGK